MGQSSPPFLVKIMGRATSSWSHGTLEGGVLFGGMLFDVGSHHDKSAQALVPGSKKSEEAPAIFLCERGFIYGDGNLRDVEAGACLQSHVRYSIQSDSVSAPHCGASVSVDIWASPLVRLYGETFQINCISLSVKLGSKLICITAPHDHCNSSSGFAAAKCNWNADGPPLSRAVTPSIPARIIG